MLGASLAIKIYHDPVTNLDDLLASDLKLAVAANSSIQEYFSEANSASVQGQLWQTKLQEEGALIENTQIFTNQLAAGLKPDTVLFGVFQSISGYGGHYPCRIEAVRRSYRKIDNGMVFQKNWPFTKLFNYHLLRLVSVLSQSFISSPSLNFAPVFAKYFQLCL